MQNSSFHMLLTIKTNRFNGQLRLKFLSIVVSILFLFSPLASASASTLQSEFARTLSDSRLENAEIGISVVNLENGNVVFSRNADVPLIPASNHKIVTAIAALDFLGKDYEFVTSVWLDGEIVDGILEGDIVIKGAGDPTIGSPAIGEDATEQFNRWARLLKKHGIDKVNGNVIIDESAFDNEYIHPDWPRDQLDRHYSAPVNGFIFHDNCIRVTVSPGPDVGAPANITLSPHIGYFQIENNCRTGPAASSNIIHIDREISQWRLRIRGEARHRTGGWSGLITVPDPAVSAGKAFVHILSNHHIEFNGEVIKHNIETAAVDDYSDMTLIALRRAPLEKVIEVILVDSQNLYAEALLKVMGKEKKGVGSWQSGNEVITDMMSNREAGEPAFRSADGSGYSRNNRITPRFLSELLRQVENDYDGFLEYQLPTAGQDGTLARRLAAEKYRERVNAKSGYIARVGTLSGYVTSKSGPKYAFSIMINNFRRGSNWDMRQIQDALVEAIINHG